MACRPCVRGATRVALRPFVRGAAELVGTSPSWLRGCCGDSLPCGGGAARGVSHPLGAIGICFVPGQVAVRAPFFNSLVDKLKRIFFIVISLFILLISYYKAHF